MTGPGRRGGVPRPSVTRWGALGSVGVLTAAAVLAGCGGGSSGDDGKKEYAIGFQGPLSGDNQQLGINAYDGVLTAVELANRRKDLPFRLRLVASDDQGMAEQGPTAAQKLIDNPEVIGVVGPVFSGPTKSSEPLYSGAGLLSVSPSATNPALTDLGFTSFYRVIAPDTVQGSAAAEYLAKVVKADKVYSLDDRSEYGTGLSGALEKALTGRGIRVIHDGINPTKDYTSQATKILAENPDAVYYSGYYAELALLTRALRSKGYTGKVVSGDGANDDQLIHQAGAGNAEGTLLTCPCGDPNSDPAAAGFVADYKTINADARPGTYSGEAYDATNAVIEVLRRLGSGATREAVLARFGSVDIPGVTKRIRFRKNGEVEGSTVYVYEVRAGKRAVLGPVSSLVRP
ncbi:amino acid/amide ABC transporter substrate-binding protein, HAAT family [Frankia casuarinae]|uniref:Amino acid/amide ABC transporter substrate-binding protein, HAAT family n=2 Tax=Frankia casuarinae (strain DSM 45818 / CECT 9043 / HFP020203 / CcI3) TaxID=106370 RepID=Q2JCJ6_FRACC|nr:amino acid/amide ABC transporter substrate-binding protein, HAAT family [Frankia casuarinae]ETA00672.1 amino acid/amide ABC transporter substrate-binding protein, HAAT family [Frankia sp. CcI6]EYT91380.1 amino acid/amide ABC transporter substrate-binding protein, HAAT family [Frankia casuarinae]KDA41786.1 amino acid/amide ABC transporter substrate-binding protein, HAAT family [Frankia sp. BMG5.23]OAA28897.1 amino acid/amide ABC transporter substrate-binding protein, HAAT family [Frankia casu